MSRIHQVLLHSPSDYHNIMMWAVCCTAFFGFLRCSEFTIPSPSEFEPATHLSIKDMAIDDKTSSLIRVTIKQSKTDPFHKGVHLFLGRTDYPIYLTACGNTAGQLFITEEGCLLTREHFSNKLSRVLQAAGCRLTSRPIQYSQFLYWCCHFSKKGWNSRYTY